MVRSIRALWICATASPGLSACPTEAETRVISPAIGAVIRLIGALMTARSDWSARSGGSVAVVISRASTVATE
ncbi:hypothetical protein CS379_05145 [Methylobacterium frigidaeris]|nr:hypothetical protein CS379_05145 [Methylobacterium frigidaeris]